MEKGDCWGIEMNKVLSKIMRQYGGRFIVRINKILLDRFHSSMARELNKTRHTILALLFLSEFVEAFGNPNLARKISSTIVSENKKFKVLVGEL